MDTRPDAGLIRTRRLDLVTLSPTFVRALAAGDVPAAELAIGARVGASLVRDPNHVIQLHVAMQAAEAAGLVGTGRVIMLGRTAARRVIGSVGFHGLPDNRGRLEAGCRIEVASQGHGYGVEALTALLQWATARFGVRRFLVAVPSAGELISLQTVDVAIGDEPLPVRLLGCPQRAGARSVPGRSIGRF